MPQLPHVGRDQKLRGVHTTLVCWKAQPPLELDTAGSLASVLQIPAPLHLRSGRRRFEEHGMYVYKSNQKPIKNVYVRSPARQRGKGSREPPER